MIEYIDKNEMLWKESWYNIVNWKFQQSFYDKQLFYVWLKFKVKFEIALWPYDLNLFSFGLLLQFGPELVLVSAGFDAALGDPLVSIGVVKVLFDKGNSGIVK